MRGLFVGWLIACIKSQQHAMFVGWLIACIKSQQHAMFVGCFTSQQHASVSQGPTCTNNFTCCHTEIQVADHTFYLTQSQYTDTGQTSPSDDPPMPGAWQGSLECPFLGHWYDLTRRKRDSNPGSSASEADALTTRPTRRSDDGNSNERV